jgi:hypothetical protein
VDSPALEVGDDLRRRVSAIMGQAEAHRYRADYNTGSILEEEAYLLAALSEALQARVVIEVGTFIGTSTLSLALGSAVQAVYTCDGSNDCLPATDVIRTYPKRTSTHMLRDLSKLGVRADLCFFDGVLQQADSILLQGMVHDRTVYAFHDYNHGPKLRCKHGKQFMETVPRKGIGNVELLKPWLPSHRLVEPPTGTTLALLVPS